VSGLDIGLRLARGGFSLAVDFELPASGITVVFGTSGSGKTTLLRAIAGLEPEARGHVRVGGQIWQDDAAGVRVPVWQRGVGYVFQEASLFPHLDVRRNIDYGLRWQRRHSAPRREQGGQDLDALIDLLGIAPLTRRQVDTLSGGERQRVAIARAMAVQPALLLLDEPLAALDFARRDEIIEWLLELRNRTGTPMLYVTHSLDEMARLADRVVVMQSGKVIASGAPESALRKAGMATVIERIDRLRGS